MGIVMKHQMQIDYIQKILDDNKSISNIVQWAVGTARGGRPLAFVATNRQAMKESCLAKYLKKYKGPLPTKPYKGRPAVTDRFVLSQLDHAAFLRERLNQLISDLPKVLAENCYTS